MPAQKLPTTDPPAKGKSSCTMLLGTVMDAGRLDLYCPPEPLTDAGCATCSLRKLCQFSGKFPDERVPT